MIKIERRYIPIVLLTVIYIVVILLVTLHRFWQYEVFYYDHGIYDMALWKASRFISPTIEHLDVPGKIIFADHFHPTIFLFTPLYWLTDRQEIILIGQAVVIGVAIFFAYLIAEQLIKSKLLRFALIISFMGFIGFQNAIIANFHDVTIAILPFLICVWAIQVKKWKLYWISLAFMLGSREMMGIVGASLGLYMFFKNKIPKKYGLITILISLSYWFIAINLIIPFFAHRPYIYQPQYPATISEGFIRLFYPWIKLRTIFWSLLTFGFLPVFYPPLYPAILQDYFIRFVLNTGSARWDLGLHYNVTITPILFLSAVEAARIWEKRLKNKLFINLYAVVILGIALSMHYFFHGPLGLAYNFEFYKHTGRQKFMDDFVNAIPKEGLIMAPNNIAARLTHYNVILLRGNYKVYNPDVIVVDLREGQNANNFWPLQEESTRRLRDNLKMDKNYKDIMNDPNRHIFVKL